MADLRVGDRVRIKGDPERWTMPFRDWARKGRLGTVVQTAPLHNHYLHGQVRVRFDTKRPPKRPDDYVSWWSKINLELVEKTDG